MTTYRRVSEVILKILFGTFDQLLFGPFDQLFLITAVKLVRKFFFFFAVFKCEDNPHPGGKPA